jgi:hypothetical protein
MVFPSNFGIVDGMDWTDPSENVPVHIVQAWGGDESTIYDKN